MAPDGPKVGEKRVESLGWMTESTVMPRKHRAIEGVGASSILELKAQLYKSQEESKRQPKEPIRPADHQYGHQLEVHRAKKIISDDDSFSHRNSGVEARAAKDKLALKAIKDGSTVRAALEKKAELYDKLVRGEVSDEEDNEKYSVDFFRKSIEQNESGIPQWTHVPAPESRENDGNYNDDDEDDDDQRSTDTKAQGLGRESATVDRSQQKKFVMEVHEEAKQAREKVSEVKARRQEQVAARREKLKQAYLRKRLGKLMASKET